MYFCWLPAHRHHQKASCISAGYWLTDFTRKLHVFLLWNAWAGNTLTWAVEVPTLDVKNFDSFHKEGCCHAPSNRVDWRSERQYSLFCFDFKEAEVENYRTTATVICCWGCIHNNITIYCGHGSSSDELCNANLAPLAIVSPSHMHMHTYMLIHTCT